MSLPLQKFEVSLKKSIKNCISLGLHRRYQTKARQWAQMSNISLYIWLSERPVHCLSTWKEFRNCGTYSSKRRLTAKPLFFASFLLPPAGVGTNAYFIEFFCAGLGQTQTIPWRSAYWDHSAAREKKLLVFSLQLGSDLFFFHQQKIHIQKGSRVICSQCLAKMGPDSNNKSEISSSPLKRWLCVSEQSWEFSSLSVKLALKEPYPLLQDVVTFQYLDSGGMHPLFC